MKKEDLKDELVEEAKRVLDEQMTHREKLDEKAFNERKKGGEWSPEEIEHLKNNRTEMSNEELEDFMLGNEYTGDWKPFSRTEERYILESFNTSDIETIADALNRSVENVEKKIKMMGLDVEDVR